MTKRFFSFLFAILLTLSPALAEPSVTAYADHFLLSDMNAGACQALTGTVELVVVFVSVESSPWTEEEIAARRQELLTACRMLRTEAASYGAQLNLTLQVHVVSADAGPDMQTSENWVDRILFRVPGLPNRYDRARWSNTPLILFCSTPGRAFAHCESSDREAEYAILYHTDDSAVIRHELLHLFGAMDYYVDAVIADAAGRLCPSSIMMGSEYANSVDDLTAYVVGWTSQPGSVGMQLLSETAQVTAASFAQAQAANQTTGLGRVTGSDSTYLGMMVDGVPEGWGMITWDSGDSYLGFWQEGLRDGTGVYTWPDGTVYTGDFVDGHRTGQGSSFWSDGSSYTGGYLNGFRHGYGVYIWPNGDTYAGDFVYGERTGQGTLIKADGVVYRGDFVQGRYEGSGTMIFADGATYTGGFHDNRFSGTGTYRWANGSSYTGEFANGLRHGSGVYRNANGGVVEGRWVNDAFTE